MIEPTCRVCGTELNDENRYPANQKTNNCICKKCEYEKARVWRIANPEKTRAHSRRTRYKRGERPFNENKECAVYLGVHIAERVLSHVFEDVEVMPYGNRGYDFICNRGKKIDVKSSCLNGTENPRWLFNITRNTIADYFICLAFDNREDLNPLYAWLIPGNVVSHLKNATIKPSIIHKWDEYRLDISKISACCDTLSRVG